MEEVLMVPPKEMEKLIRYYKGELTENAWLNTAARTAARRDLLLKSQLPAGIIKAKVNPLSRELHHLTKRVRRGPVGGLGGQLGDDEDEEDDSLVTGPMEQVVKRLIKATLSKKDIQKAIVKEVKREIKTPSPASASKSATPSSVPGKSATAKSYSSTHSADLRKQTEAVRQKVRARRQTELEKLKTVPGWSIWDKPVKRKLKDDF